MEYVDQALSIAAAIWYSDLSKIGVASLIGLRVLWSVVKFVCIRAPREESLVFKKLKETMQGGKVLWTGHNGGGLLQVGNAKFTLTSGSVRKLSSGSDKDCLPFISRKEKKTLDNMTQEILKNYLESERKAEEQLTAESLSGNGKTVLTAKLLKMDMTQVK